jgi:hypothetical protein
MNIGKGYRNLVKETSRKMKRKRMRNGNLEIRMFLLYTIRKILLLKFIINDVNYCNVCTSGIIKKN